MTSRGLNSFHRFPGWRWSLLSATIVIAFSFAATPLFSDSKPQLLMPGMFHGGEVTVENGSTWLAVVPQPGHGFVIEEVSVVVETVFDPIVDAEGETTGLLVSAPSCLRTPLFLIRETDAIQTGSFDTSYSGPIRLEINEPFPIKVFSQRRYALLIECDPNASRTVDNFVECPLVLEHELIRQKLTTFTVYVPPDGDPSITSEAVPQLWWAGDIDRDGKLDLLLDLSNHYNASRPTLFLSSEAGEDELVGEAASLVITGC
jgi:hypothetical protein